MRKEKINIDERGLGSSFSRSTALTTGLHASSFDLDSGFTLIELLTVILIIGVLIGLLVPAISHVRRSAEATAVTAQIASLEQAIGQYYSDFHAYPGPVSNMALGTNSSSDRITYDPTYTGPKPGAFSGGGNNLISQMTGTENLVLGLAGGLKAVPAGAAAPRGGAAPVAYYNPTLLGGGAESLNSALPKKFKGYIDTADLSSGLYSDDVVKSISDTPIPEILDRFPNRMPILYLRANVGADGKTPPTGSGTYTPQDRDNPVVIDEQQINAGVRNSMTPVVRQAAYDISQITEYTKSYNGFSIGVGKSAPTYVGWGTPPTGPNGAKYPFHGLQDIEVTATLNKGNSYKYPYPAYPYFLDPNSPANNPTARAKDSYILISAGLDRIYGTADDITSFGSVVP